VTRQSAGLLVYRVRDGALEVFLVHPGGPFWKNKDAGAWSIPKGEFEPDEEPLTAARREFAEETGVSVDGPFHPLPPRRLRSGKIVHAFAVKADIDADVVRSNTFALEWPPRSGRHQEFPEVDRGAWFAVEEALVRINVGQRAFLADLHDYLARTTHTGA
jgi:predicted NUDIX family NTP pyrophosphohydrolase